MTDVLSFKAWGIEATATGGVAIASLTAIVLVFLLCKIWRRG